jgi:outer membrane lipoprotein SlyB
LIPRFLLCVTVVAALSGCGPSYSPNTYSSTAVQQANKVEQGIVVGVREVGVSAAGTIGTVTGAAAGGIAGSQAAAGPVSALTALGGGLLGGLAGNAAEQVISDTKAFEYIVRKPNGDLVSVTQKDTVPLALGQQVLVIAGNQARVVPDYTTQSAPPVKQSGKAETSKASPEPAIDKAGTSASPTDSASKESGAAATNKVTDPSGAPPATDQHPVTPDTSPPATTPGGEPRKGDSGP